MDGIRKRMDETVYQKCSTASRDDEKQVDKMHGQWKNRSDKHGEVAGLGTSKCKLDKTNSVTVIEAASGGTMLRGILLSKNLDDALAKRKQLVQLTGDVQLRGADIPAITEEIEFVSKGHSDVFTRYLATSGISFALSTTLSCSDASFKSEATLNYQCENDKSLKYVTEVIYASSIKCFVVPMSSVQFTSNILKLSDEALEDLLSMETQIVSSSEKEKHDICTRFFSKYGSHGYVGHANLGGIYIWETTFEGQTKQSHEQITKLCKTINKSFAEAGLSGLDIKSGTILTAESFTERALKMYKCKKEDIAKTSLSCRTYGGSPVARNLQEWQTSLREDKTSWMVIDKGQDYDPNDYIGVWDLIKNQKTVFENYEKLSKALSSAYQKIMTGESIVTATVASCSFEQFSSVIKKITTEAENTGRLSSYCNALQQLVAEMQKLERNIGNARPWVELLLNEDKISDFLLRPMTHLQHRYINNTKERSIKENIGLLVEPAKGNAKQHKKIRQICKMIEYESLGSNPLKAAIIPVVKPVTDFIEKHIIDD